jgi:hypothetical protein
MVFPSTSLSLSLRGVLWTQITELDGRLLPTPTLLVFQGLGNFFNFTASHPLFLEPRYPLPKAYYF